MMRVAVSEGSRVEAQKWRLVSSLYCVHQLRKHGSESVLIMLFSSAGNPGLVR